MNERGSGWTTPPTVFADWGNEGWEGHVGVESLKFGTSVADVIVQDTGYGYMMPVEITVVDGRPRPSDANPFGVFEHPQLDLNSTYMEAIFEVNSTDENGSILDLRIISGGAAVPGS